MSEVYLALYAPSSVQKLTDFLKTVYAVPGVVPVVIRPFGAAAQVGVPEAHRISYKLNKPLIILPEIGDLANIIGCNCLYYLLDEGEEVDVQRLLGESACRKTALILCSGEHEPGAKELSGVKAVWIAGVPRGIPPIGLAGILIYKINDLKSKCGKSAL
ncbi:MAG: RecB-family nuclease [Desulfurococcaceae archaeon]